MSMTRDLFAPPDSAGFPVLGLDLSVTAAGTALIYWDAEAGELKRRFATFGYPLPNGAPPAKYWQRVADVVIGVANVVAAGAVKLEGGKFGIDVVTEGYAYGKSGEAGTGSAQWMLAETHGAVAVELLRRFGVAMRRVSSGTARAGLGLPTQKLKKEVVDTSKPGGTKKIEIPVKRRIKEELERRGERFATEAHMDSWVMAEYWRLNRHLKGK